MIWGTKSQFAIECEVTEVIDTRAGRAVWGSASLWVAGVQLGDPKEAATLGGLASHLQHLFHVRNSEVDRFCDEVACKVFYRSFDAIYDPSKLHSALPNNKLYALYADSFVVPDGSVVFDGYWCIRQELGTETRIIAIPQFVNCRDLYDTKWDRFVEIRVPSSTFYQTLTECENWIESQ